MLIQGPNAASVGRGMLEQQHVVILDLEQRALEVVRFAEGDPPEVATAQHLVFALQVQAREQLGHPLQVARGRGRLADSVVKGETQYQSAAPPQRSEKRRGGT